MHILLFLGSVIVVSLSGVMAPGPITAATITMGTRSRYAGIIISAGHIVIELPVIVLIILGFNKILESSKTQIAIGFAGGIFLLLMGVQMLRGLGRAQYQSEKKYKASPFVTGIILSATNPFFLLWWATIGLGLAMNASSLGIFALVLFALVHWLCDFVWLGALSWASFAGSELLGPGKLRLVLTICALAMFFFAVKFIYGAVVMCLK